MTNAERIEQNNTELQECIAIARELPDAEAITIDNKLDSESTNPVQNKVITEALNAKADKATTYTKTEVDGLIANSGGGGSNADLSNYVTLDTEQEITGQKVFIYEDEDGAKAAALTYDGWMVTDGSWGYSSLSESMLLVSNIEGSSGVMARMDGILVLANEYGYAEITVDENGLLVNGEPIGGGSGLSEEDRALLDRLASLVNADEVSY